MAANLRVLCILSLHLVFITSGINSRSVENRIEHNEFLKTTVNGNATTFGEKFQSFFYLIYEDLLEDCLDWIIIINSFIILFTILKILWSQARNEITNKCKQ
jgi:hypothetical protein